MTIPHRWVSRQVALAAFFFAIGIVVAGVPWARAGVPCHGVSGVASWYGAESGSRTATGEHFDGTGLTAAMPSRSMLGNHVRVTFGDRSVVVLVNDLGPAARLHRIIDLSRAAAARLGLPGIGRVCVENIG